MRYFKFKNEIYAYDADQEHLITDEMVEIKGKALEKLLNPPIQEVFNPIANRQFKLALLDLGIIDDLELAIKEIEDSTLKRKIQIEYEYAEGFKKDDESIVVMLKLLNFSTKDVENLWVKALSL